MPNVDKKLLDQSIEEANTRLGQLVKDEASLLVFAKDNKIDLRSPVNPVLRDKQVHEIDNPLNNDFLDRVHAINETNKNIKASCDALINLLESNELSSSQINIVRRKVVELAEAAVSILKKTHSDDIHGFRGIREYYKVERVVTGASQTLFAKEAVPESPKSKPSSLSIALSASRANTPPVSRGGTPSSRGSSPLESAGNSPSESKGSDSLSNPPKKSK